MNLKHRAKGYVDKGQVRQALNKHFSYAITDMLMDWLRLGIEKDRLTMSSIEILRLNEPKEK